MTNTDHRATTKALKCQQLPVLANAQNYLQWYLADGELDAHKSFFPGSMFYKP